jgi:outer membrane protein assembly factor BamB
MVGRFLLQASGVPIRTWLALLLFQQTGAFAAEWPQYRGPTTDGISLEAISTNWPASGPTVVWRNSSLANGFSSFAVSQGRAFVLVSQDDGTGSGQLLECCVGLDAATGAPLWTTPIDVAPWDPNSPGDGGDGAYPYNTGDGPRTTPSVKDGRVFALSGLMHLVCLNATNGSVVWSNDLVSAYGASTIPWENCASPCVDNDLLFVNLNSSPNDQNLAAFRTSNGSLAWSSQNENVTHATPTVATIQGMRQVIFPTQTGLVSLNRTNGNFLWKLDYPFDPISTSMGASPIVYSNIVYCTAAYGRGAVAARITLSSGTWTATQLYFRGDFNHRSIWMSPVCYQGYVYSLAGENSTFLTAPLNCIELATGDLKWSVDNFGMGGLILINTNLLVLTEDGQFVLIQPSPAAYIELARYQAFEFSDSTPGKCWNSPAFSNGRIYAHSTREGLCLDVAPGPPRLKLLSAQFLNSTQFKLVVGTLDGTALDSNRLPKIEVRATNSVAAPPSTWPKLTNPLVLGTDGVARLTNTIRSGQSRQFYRTVEQP